MKAWIVVVAWGVLAGCGVETVGTAATSAQLKKQELEAGKKTQQRAQEKIDQATQQMHERAQKAGDTESR